MKGERRSGNVCKVRARLQDPFTRDYYRRGGVDLLSLLEPYLRQPPTVYGPEFDRASLVDINRDLFPKDEFAVGYAGRRTDSPISRARP